MNTQPYFLMPLVWFGLALFAVAEEEHESKSAARPYNLDIVAPVQIAGSDAASKAFQTGVLPGMLDLVNQFSGEYNSIKSKTITAVSLDPAKLTLGADSTARVYFLGENTGFRNTLGISTTGGSPLSADAALIFPNASTPNGSKNLVRSANAPLLAGDFVDLGAFKAGTTLDYFLIANGANGGKDFFSTDQSLNKDGIVHAVSLAANGSAYLIIGFEDMKGGGERDYNDLFFAVELIKVNATNLTGLGAPEPSMALGALFAGVLFLGFTRRRIPLEI